MSDSKLGWRPPLSPWVYLQPRRHSLPFPWGTSDVRLYPNSAEAMRAGTAMIGLRVGDEILVPRCPYGWDRAGLDTAGFVCRGYEGGAGLEPDEDELNVLANPRTRALYLVHHLGFPQDSRRWRRWCDERGFLLVEDGGWLAHVEGHPVGAVADLATFSLDATLGVPMALSVRGQPASSPIFGSPIFGSPIFAKDVTALMLLHPTGEQAAEPMPLVTRRATVAEVGRRHFEWVTARSAVAAGLLGGLGRVMPEPPEANATGGQWPPFLLERLANPGVAARRRSHYLHLLENLAELVHPAFATLPPGASPLVFPVMGDDELSGRLLRRGIEPWSLGALPARGTRRESHHGHLLGLPVHQELRVRDLERIVDATAVRRRRPLTVQVHHDLDELGPEWDHLAERTGNLFGTREWLSSWWRHRGSGRPAILACRDHTGRLVGSAPLYWATEAPVGLLRFQGHEAGDELGPLCAPVDRARVAAALRGALRRLDGWQLLVGEQLPAQDAWAALLGGYVARREGSPVLSFAGVESWDDLLAGYSANLRQQVRRRERNLRRRFTLDLRMTTDPSRLDHDLEELFRLHALRWGAPGVFDERGRALHREFARRAFERGWLRLWLLHLDGEPAAAWYGFRFAGEEWFYQSGRDRRFDALRPGFVLLAHTIRQALADGMTRYRFLRGEEPYKLRFATHDPGLETVVVGSGLGRLAAAGAVVAGRLPPHARLLLRALLERKKPAPA